MPTMFNFSRFTNVFSILILCAGLVALSGCASTGEDARSLLDRIEFGEDEIGCVDLRGEVSLSPSIIFSQKATIILKKEKRGPNGEAAPQC